MATFLDVGLLENFGVIFVILLVFLIVFGILEYIKAFGEGRRGLHAIIALVVALLFLVSKVATAMIKMMVPWFMVIVIFFFFMLFIVRMFGRTEADMKNLIADPNVYPWVIIFGVLILLLALGNALGQDLLEKGEGTQAPTNYTDATGVPGTGLDPSTDWGNEDTIPSVVTKDQTVPWDIGAYVS